ncbi:MAG: hypothetical protein RR310_07875 [Eubacterium sp.]
MEKAIYAYPAVFTLIDDEKITFSFPDLQTPEMPIAPEKMPKAFDIAADALGKWISELFILDKPLPNATSLESLPLKANQKGVWIQIIEA